MEIILWNNGQTLEHWTFCIANTHFRHVWISVIYWWIARIIFSYIQLIWYSDILVKQKISLPIPIITTLSSISIIIHIRVVRWGFEIVITHTEYRMIHSLFPSFYYCIIIRHISIILNNKKVFHHSKTSFWYIILSVIQYECKSFTKIEHHHLRTGIRR